MTGAFTVPELASAEWHEKIMAELGRQHALLQKNQLDAIDERIQQLSFNCENFSIEDGWVTFNGKYAGSRPDAPRVQREPETSMSAGNEQIALVDALARELIPWRKGPFRLGHLAIDAEWRSDKKWDRLAPALPDLTGKIVADIGCNNGYYLYRIAAAGAANVIGFDPTLKYWLQYRLLAAHAPRALPIDYLPLGWQYLTAFPETFDIIFLMGVNYHEAEPLNLFHACLAALKPGGLLVCESVVVPGDADLEIFPAGKYAGIGGVYSIPTATALASQLALCGFPNVRIQHNVLLTATEQRSAEFSPQKSLVDSLQTNGFSIEGYPPPHRAALFAFR